MLKKVFLIFFLIFIITGCNVNYELNLENGKIEENIIMEFDKKDCNDERIECETYINNTLNSLHSLDSYPEYSYDYNENGNSIIVKLNYLYDSLEEWKEHNVYETLFNEVLITKNELKLNGYAQDTERSIISNYSVTLHTDREVNVSNANSVDKARGIYKWEFASNSQNINIDIEFADINKASPINTMQDIFITVLIVIGILSLAGIIFLFVKLKIKNSNKI